QSRDTFAETLALYERALALDPRSVEAQSQVANMLAIRAGNGWTEFGRIRLSSSGRTAERGLAALGGAIRHPVRADRLGGRAGKVRSGALSRGADRAWAHAGAPALSGCERSMSARA